MDTDGSRGVDVCEVFCSNEEKVKALKGQIIGVSGLAEIFKALSDETRAKIVYCLSKDELCVCDIANILDMTVAAVSHHLRVLRNLKLVKYRKDGKLVFYSLDDDHVVRLIRESLEHLKEGVTK